MEWEREAGMRRRKKIVFYKKVKVVGIGLILLTTMDFSPVFAVTNPNVDNAQSISNGVATRTENYTYDVSVDYNPMNFQQLKVTLPIPEQYVTKELGFRIEPNTNFYNYKTDTINSKITSVSYDNPITSTNTLRMSSSNFIVSSKNVNYLGFTFKVKYTDIQTNELIDVTYNVKFINAALNINYVDENNTIISEPQRVTGSVGDLYDASAEEYKKIIPGYTISEAKLPTHTQGVFSTSEQDITYFYTKNKAGAGNVTAKYVDTDGTPISGDVVKAGVIGEDYTTEQKDIPGYTFKEVQGYVTGKFTDQPQTVTYVYEQYKDKSTVLVHDSELTVGDTWKPEDNFDSSTDYYGNTVPFSNINVAGQVDTTKSGTYKVTYRRFVPNFFSASENQGTYSAIATITVKDAQPLKGGDITTKYVDTDGNALLEDAVQTGNIGENYTTERKEFDGYTFKEVQGNATGQFTNQVQTVTYVYTKNEIPNLIGTVIVRYVDTDDNSISEDVVKSGTVGESYITDKKVIEGYSFKEVRGNISGQYNEQPQTVSYVYVKDEVGSESGTNNNVKDEVGSESKTHSKTSNKRTALLSEQALPKTGENERMALVNSTIGAVLLATGLLVYVFRFKRVNK